MRTLAVCVCGFLLIASSVSAAPPDPANCVCTLDATGRLYMAPDQFGTQPHPSGDFFIEVRDATGAFVQPATVRVSVGGQSGGFTTLCPGVDSVKTTPTGMFNFNIAGGGCYKNVSGGAVTIQATDGVSGWVTIRQYHHVMSSDYDDWGNVGLPFRWNHRVNPADLAAFIQAYQGGVGVVSCHDYDNDGVTGPTDLGVFVIAYRGGTGGC